MPEAPVQAVPGNTAIWVLPVQVAPGVVARQPDPGGSCCGLRRGVREGISCAGCGTTPDDRPAKTNRHRTISLCGVLPAVLQYRYGTVAQVELQFPEQASKGAEQLRYAHYSRYRTDRAEVSFIHADIGYAMFDYDEDGQHSAGVHVTTADGAEHEVRCAGPIHGQLASLGKSLRCDSDNALNGGRCP